MAHLKKSTSGKLLRASGGHLCKSCCDGYDCNNCPCLMASISGCSITPYNVHFVFPWNCTAASTFNPVNDENNVDYSISLYRTNENGPLTLTIVLELDTGNLHTFSVDVSSCPIGEYSVPFVSADSTPVCEDPLTVTFVEELCCSDGEPEIGPFYLSCVIQWDEWTDVDCDMADCDGNGGGGNTVHSVNASNTLTDEPASMFDIDPCYLESDNAFSGYFPECGSDKFFFQRLVSNEWQVVFGLCTDGDYRFKTVKLGGLTPVGTYPDIDYCYNDGCTATHVQITSIAVTA